MFALSDNYGMNARFVYDDKAALVPLSEVHVPLLTRWICDPGVTYYLDIAGGLAPEQESQFIERMRQSQSDQVYGICPAEGEECELIGVCGLHRISQVNRNAEFGIFIGEKEEWGSGYGTAACRLICDFGFNVLNLHRIHLRVFDFNERGIRSYEKVGFSVEGRARESLFRDGRYCDVLLMGLLRDEFNAQQEEWRAAQRKRYGLPGLQG